MTIKEIHNRVVEHFIVKKSAPSFLKKDNNYRCLYRGPNGTRCPVGLFIPDNKYSQALEMQPLQAVFQQRMLDFDLPAEEQELQKVFAYFQNCQRAHDLCLPLEEDFHGRFEQELSKLAKAFQLI
jgi:hypothetical protein